MEGLTISEMAQTLGIKETAVRKRLFLTKRIPFLSRISLYTQADLEAIKNVKQKGWPKQPVGGWPKKEEAEDGDLPEKGDVNDE
jgi:hypothetical protein